MVLGESIGTGFASYHASLQPPDQLILLAAFTDLLDIAKNRFWFYPTSLMVDNALDNEVFLQDYRGRVLQIHGDQDTIIPYELGQKLHASISTEKQFVTITGAGHNDLFKYEQTYQVIETALQRHRYPHNLSQDN